MIHVEAPDTGVRFEERSGSSYRFVCAAPCDAAVPLEGTYRIGGSIRSSRPFSLTGQAGERFVVTVDGASNGVFDASLVMIALGAASLLVGTVTYGISSGLDDLREGDSYRGGKIGGAVMLGSGAVSLVTGGILAIVNSHSRVHVMGTRGVTLDF